MERLTLNQAQLEQLSNIMTFVFLGAFQDAKTPSEAAKMLNLPANTVHYHVNRLADVGLLKVVNEQGRSKTYQTVAMHFRIAKDEHTRFCQKLTQDISGQLKKLERRFIEATEKAHLNPPNYIEDPHDSNYVLLDLENNFKAPRYESVFHLLEVTLSQEQYLTINQKLADLLNEVKDSPEKGEICTFALISFPGRGMMNGSH